MTDDGLLRIEGWARDGLTEEQIAKNIGVNVKTLWDWKNKFDPICNALKRGKEPVDIEVENALLKSALGYTITIKKTIKIKEEKQKAGEGKIVTERIEYVEEEIHIPAQVPAQIFWLKNRKPEQWRDKRNVVDAEADDDPLIEMLRRLDDESKETTPQS